MATQYEYALNKQITSQMEEAAKTEAVSPEFVRNEIALGRAVLPCNINHKNLKPAVIGRMFKCKINANLGLSDIQSDQDKEFEKLNCAVKWGADAVMDLSTGGNLREILAGFVKRSPVPVGTVPIYKALERVEKIEDISLSLMLEIIEEEAAAGVDFMTIHAGLLKRHIPLIDKRLTGIVSRGGAMIAKWMNYHDKENFLYTGFERICEILKKYDVAFSLGDGMRPGSLADASDQAQYGELDVLGELVKISRKNGVQVMVEGPGHIPLNLVEENVSRALKICDDAPFYVLGPLVTDIGAGYDHISSAIGASVAAWKGAALLCYVTPKEHLGLPNLEDVRQGIMAYKIAAHAGDIAKGLKGARDIDDAMSCARKELDWPKQFQLSLDPERAKQYRQETSGGKDITEKKFCSMCGSKFCAVEICASIKAKQQNTKQ